MTKLMKEREELPEGFSQPTALPANPDEQQKWQNANRTWWENHPMRYDWKDGIQYQEFSKEFFIEIDRRFFGAVELYAPCEKIPFDWLIDFDSLKAKDVLEIGVGNGSHAQLLAEHVKSFTGIDLTHTRSRAPQRECASLVSPRRWFKWMLSKCSFRTIVSTSFGPGE